MPTTRNSSLYTQLDVNKYLSKAYDRGGLPLYIPFQHTVVTGELNGDSVNLCTIPANVEVLRLDAITDGLGAGVTVTIGDSGNTSRLMASTALATGENNGRLAMAGARWRPASDTTVYLTYGGANPTVGQTLKGHLEVVAP